ncbi:Rv0340 family IniB-related protein [Mycolicibacterium setense]
MANTLLDFVMSLVRDPDAAAHYAADPAQALAEANLTDVTSVDVDNLIPVVSESLSMTGANGGLGGPGAADPGGNVWASGAATAAFDAFGDHVPLDAPNNAWDTTAGQVIDEPGSLDQFAASVIDDGGLVNQSLDDLSLQLNEPAIEDAPIAEPAPTPDWDQPAVDDQHHTDSGGGFDIFD